MKIFIFTLFCLTASDFCFSQLKLSLGFPTVPEGKIFIYDYNHFPLDTFNIQDGRVSLTISGKNPTFLYLVIAGYNEDRPLHMLLSDEETIMEFDTLTTTNESSYAALYPNYPRYISDPNNNKVFYAFQKMFVTFSDLIIENSSNSLFEKRKLLYNSFINDCDSLIYRNRDKFVSGVIINYLINNNLLPIQTVQDFYNYLSRPVKKNYFGIRIGTELGVEGRLKKGNPAPEFDLFDLEENKYSLKEIRNKRVLLHFWSASCAPCIKEAPELIRLAKEFEKSVVTINVSNDISKERWLTGITKAAINEMINIHDSAGKVFDDYNIRIIPAYYLIGEQHNILAKGTLEQITDMLKSD